MTLSIKSSYHLFSSDPKPSLFTRGNVAAAIVDIGIICSLAVVGGGLRLGFIPLAALPLGIGALGNSLAYGLTAISITLIFADGLCLIVWIFPQTHSKSALKKELTNPTFTSQKKRLSHAQSFRLWHSIDKIDYTLLPPELIAHVFSFLESPIDKSKVKLVNKYFYRVAKDCERRLSIEGNAFFRLDIDELERKHRIQLKKNQSNHVFNILYSQDREDSAIDIDMISLRSIWNRSKSKYKSAYINVNTTKVGDKVFIKFNDRFISVTTFQGLSYYLDRRIKEYFYEEFSAKGGRRFAYECESYYFTNPRLNAILDIPDDNYSRFS